MELAETYAELRSTGGDLPSYHESRDGALLRQIKDLTEGATETGRDFNPTTQKYEVLSRFNADRMR